MLAWNFFSRGPPMRFLSPVVLVTLMACSNNAEPNAPSDVSALPGNGFVRVLWQDNSDDETGFAVYRETVTPEEVSRSLVASVSADLTEWDDLDVEVGSTYRYAVAATGERNDSNLVEMTGDPVGPLEGSLVDCTVGDATAEDQDADGVPDADEEQGWTVTITNGVGKTSSYDVSSSPLLGDTDGDGLCDREERQSVTDPTQSDTDADGLSDTDELRIWASKPTDVDSDGDSQGNAALFDGNEVDLQGTSPTIADTDGDGIDDYVEIIERGDPFHPLVANTPQLVLDFVGNTDITLNIGYTDGQTQAESEDVEIGREKASAQSNTRSSTHENWAEVGIEATVEASAGFPSGASVSASTTVSASAGYTHTNSNSVTDKSSQLSRSSYQRGLSTSSEEGRQIEDGTIGVGFQVRNVGNVSYTLSDLEVTALLRDASDPSQFTAISTLEFDLPKGGVGLAPNDATGKLYGSAEVPANRALELLANPEDLFFDVATFNLLDDKERNFDFLQEVTNAQTGQVIIDFGDGTVLDHRVATNVLRDNGQIVGVTLGTVMTQALEMDYRTATPDNGAPDVLVAVTKPDGGEVAVDEKGPAFWVVIGSNGVEIDTTTAFNDIVLKAGEAVTLFYVKDLDGDGLFTHEEYLYRTSDDMVDTDGDGLTDYEEVRVGWEVTAMVDPYPASTFSNPTQADSDFDGLNDFAEREAETDPYNPDTDGDGDCDGDGNGGAFNCSGEPDADPLDPLIGAIPDPDPVAAYFFEGDLYATIGGGSFSPTGGCSKGSQFYGPDRNNLADSALDIDVNDDCGDPTENAGMESSLTYDFDDDFTMMMWVNLEQAFQSTDWYLAGAEDVLSLRMEVIPGSPDEFNVAYYEGGKQVFVDSTDRQGDTWVHVALVVDGNAARIYVNGTLADSGSHGAAVTTLPMLILHPEASTGQNGSFGLNGQGRFDDLYFYDVALDDKQMADVYKTQL